MDSYYNLADRPTNKEVSELHIEDEMIYNITKDGNQGIFIRGKTTGEFRKPKKGEWYLSGAIPEAYCAPGDLSCEYNILRLVVIEKTIIERVVKL